MKVLLVLVLVLLLSTSLTALALLDSGHISMVWGEWVIDTSLTFALAVVLVIFGIIYLLLRLVFNLFSLPNYLKHRRQFKQYAKGEVLMAKGMLALEHGDWRVAEKQLIKTAKKSQVGLVHYLNAAKMANNQKCFKRQSQYLEEARQRFPDDYVVIGLVESRLLRVASPDVSETILAELYSQNLQDKLLLSEYASILSQQKSWVDLVAIIPSLKKFKALPREDILEIEIEISIAKLISAETIAELEDSWKSLPKYLQKHPKVLAEYIEKSKGWQQEVGVEGLIEKHISKQWDDRLVYQYGLIKLGPAFERLKKAEKWLKKQENNPILLLTLGRLACRSQLWGQAEFFLKKSLQIRPEVETFHAIATCYEAAGKDEEAALIYKEAIVKLDSFKDVGKVVDN